MSDITTRAGRAIEHCHCTQEGAITDATDPRVIGRQVPPELTHEVKLSLAAQLEAQFPGIERVALPTHEFDCHGKTLGERNCWIDNQEVEDILADNGYERVEGRARVGDLVIYRSPNGAIAHSGFVHVVGSAGQVIRVQSKWGLLGDYLHAPDAVPPVYGFWAVYRTIIR